MKRITRAGRRLACGSAAAASQPGPHRPGTPCRRVLVVTRQREAERAREPVTGVATHTHPSHSQSLEGCKKPQPRKTPQKADNSYQRSKALKVCKRRRGSRKC